MILEINSFPQNNDSQNSISPVFLEIPNDLTQEEKKHLKTYLSSFYQSKFTNQKIKFSVHRHKKSSLPVLPLKHFYQPYSWVKIREGLLDQDSGVDLSGYIGQICSFYQDDFSEIYFIEWSVKSFLSLPKEYIKYALKNDRSWRGIYIDSEDILPIHYDSGNEVFDPYFIDIFLPTRKNSELKFWQTDFMPVFQDRQNLLSSWEIIFNKTPENSAIMLINPENEAKEEEATFLEVCGSDNLTGLWAKILYQNKPLVIPLLEIHSFKDPSIQNKYSAYQNWCKAYLPE